MQLLASELPPGSCFRHEMSLQHPTHSQAATSPAPAATRARAEGQQLQTRAALPEPLPPEAHLRLAPGTPAAVLPASTSAQGKAALAWQDLLSQARGGH